MGTTFCLPRFIACLLPGAQDGAAHDDLSASWALDGRGLTLGLLQQQGADAFVIELG
jgi:hypothetical protein